MDFSDGLHHESQSKGWTWSACNNCVTKRCFMLFSDHHRHVGFFKLSSGEWVKRHLSRYRCMISNTHGIYFSARLKRSTMLETDNKSLSFRRMANLQVIHTLSSNRTTFHVRFIRRSGNRPGFARKCCPLPFHPAIVLRIVSRPYWTAEVATLSFDLKNLQ